MDTLLACILTIFIILTCYFLVCKIFISLFMITGLKHSVAKFQVFSLFFAIGYTSAESELIMNDKLRRKIAICCMVFGATLNTILAALLISIISNLNFSSNSGNTYLIRILITLIIGVIIFVATCLITKIKFLRDRTYNLLKAILYKKTVRGNIISAGDIIHDKHLVSVKLYRIPSDLVGKKLSETYLTKDGVIILSVLDPNGDVIKPNSDFTFKVGQTLEMYGSYKTIYNIFSKK